MLGSITCIWGWQQNGSSMKKFRFYKIFFQEQTINDQITWMLFF